MSRELTTLKEEQARLQQGAAEPGYLERKRELYEWQVAELAKRLLPDVRRALTQEGTSEIAEEWLSEASQALRAAVPELPPDVQGKPGFQAALKQMRAELNDSLLKDVIAPSTAEIEEHAHELAQLLLGNWFAILEHTQADDSRDVIALTVNGLPDTVDQRELYEGIETFAVPKSRLVMHFIDYLGSPTNPSARAAVELTPNRFLVTKGTERFLVRSRDAAEQLLERKEPKRVRVTFDVVLDALDPFLNTSPALFGRTEPSRAAIIEPTLERDVAIAAAYQAAREADAPFEAHSAPLVHWRQGVDVILGERQEKLSTDLAEYAVLEMKQVVQAGRLPRLMLRNRQIPVMRRLYGETELLTNREALSCLRRVSVAATGYALSGATENNLPEDFNIVAVESFVRGSPEGSELFAISVRAARHALERPESLGIAEEFRAVLREA